MPRITSQVVTVVKFGSHVEWNQSPVSWTHAAATSLMYRKIPQTNGSLFGMEGNDSIEQTTTTTQDDTVEKPIIVLMRFKTMNF